MPLPELLLHQYDTSPFSEKVRKVLAHKRLAWGAVDQPNIMPKPDLVPLTGGYRRIPVLQVGADVYCDTQLIVRVLERRHPEPTIFPDGGEATAQAWNLWADRLLFMPVVAVVFADLGPFVPKAFMDDRSKMMPGRNFDDVPKLAPYAREQVRALLATVDAQLSDGRPWLLGAAFSLADAACYHPLWFLRLGSGGQALLAEFSRVGAWMASLEAMGQGDRRDVAAADALALARDVSPWRRPGSIRTSRTASPLGWRSRSRRTTTASTRSPARWWRHRSTRSRSAAPIPPLARSWCTFRASDSGSRASARHVQPLASRPDHEPGASRARQARGRPRKRSSRPGGHPRAPAPAVAVTSTLGRSPRDWTLHPCLPAASGRSGATGADASADRRVRSLRFRPVVGCVPRERRGTHACARD
jgi:glutathione S-transferase